MGDCGCNPLVGFDLSYWPTEDEIWPDGYDPCIYNPGELRLYGKPGCLCPWWPYMLDSKDPMYETMYRFRKGFTRNLANRFSKQYNLNLDEKQLTDFRKLIYKILSECLKYEIDPTCLEKNAKKLDGLKITGPIRTSFLNSLLTQPVDKGRVVVRAGYDWCLPVAIDVASGDVQSVGVVFGYAYEGHCYRLPRPKIMLLPSWPYRIPEGDCGCDCGYDSKLGYAVWRADKLDVVVALDVRSDDLKTLVLDENVPGKRSPLAYSQVVAMAPGRVGQ
jgi:hypothetical protein